MPSREQMQYAAERLADEVRTAEREGRRRSWRKVTTLLASFGVRRLTPAVRADMGEALRAAGLICEPSFVSIDRSDTVRLSIRDTTSPSEVILVPGGGSVPDAFNGGTLTTWRTGLAPRGFTRANSDALAADEVLLIEVDPNAEPTESLHEALSVYCGEALTLEMVEDLLKADAVPKASVHDAGLRMLSTFGVLATDDLSEVEEASTLHTSTAGKLVFQPVEMILGPNWLVVCWHNSQNVLPSGPSTEGSPILRQPMMDRVRGSWSASSLRTPDDLALLITLELARSYEHARALVERRNC